MNERELVNELIDKWNTDEGKPYKGSLIDMKAYKDDPYDIGCMCAQGQVLNFVKKISQEELSRITQGEADKLVAKTLNISVSHSILLRNTNDKKEGAPAIVLTNPELVIGDNANKLLSFWLHIDSMNNDAWLAVIDAMFADKDVVKVAKIDAADAGEAAADGGAAALAPTVGGGIEHYVFWARLAAEAAAAKSARLAARLAAGDAALAASNEIQGFEILKKNGQKPFFLPLFGFDSLEDIPELPSDYGVIS